MYGVGHLKALDTGFSVVELVSPRLNQATPLRQLSHAHDILASSGGKGLLSI